MKKRTGQSNHKDFTAYWATIESNQITEVFAFVVQAEVLREAYAVATAPDTPRAGLPANAEFIGVVENVVRLYRPGDVVVPTQ